MRNNLFEPTPWPHSSLQPSQPGPAVPREGLCAARTASHRPGFAAADRHPRKHRTAQHSQHAHCSSRPQRDFCLLLLLLLAGRASRAAVQSGLSCTCALAVSRPPRATSAPFDHCTPPPPQPPALFPCVIRLCSQSILLSAIPHPHRSPLTHTLPDQSLIPLFVLQVPQLPSSAQPSTTAASPGTFPNRSKRLQPIRTYNLAP
jgi:hypothetical protein